MKFRTGWALLFAGALTLGGCVVEDDDENAGAAPDAPAQGTAVQPAPAPAPQPPDMRLEVNLAERKLYVYRGGNLVGTHPVAVGSAEWPTPTGEWTIGQVVWNPRWVPPKEESWAADEEIAEPGAPDNPLGRAQLVYQAPNSIHGTNEPSSLGKAVSHGSIRASNEVVTQLARQIMESGGAARDEAFYQRVRDNPTQREDVSIPNPVPIRVVAGN